jgi:alkyl hydroperoxide reductase subunit AhpF
MKIGEDNDHMEVDELIDHIRRRAEQVSGQQTTKEDIRQAAIEHLIQRKAQEMHNYFNSMPLEHLLHIIASDVEDTPPN